MDVKRVNKEALELRGDVDKCGVCANTVGDDMSHWKGQVRYLALIRQGLPILPPFWVTLDPPSPFKWTSN